MRQGVSVCVFAGHTGGHLFPALAFAERFKERFPQSSIVLVTSPKAKSIIEPLSAGKFDAIEYINEFPFFSGISLRTVRFLLEFSRAFLLSSKILNKTKPDLCLGFGSYVSYPGMKLACWKKIPTLIHEQNKISGKATKMLCSLVDVVATSFPETLLKGKVKRLENTGLPVRAELYASAKSNKRCFEVVSGQKPLRVLIVGGSQGAHKLNKSILESFFRLLPEERKKVAVTHITGTKDFESAAEEYKKMKMDVRVYPFYKKMQELYSQADVAITRSGANTLFELALFGVPALVVPFPHAAENHQEVNARFFESRGAVQMIQEESLNPEFILSFIQAMMNPELRQQCSQRLTEIAPGDAAEKLAEIAAGLLPKGIL